MPGQERPSNYVNLFKFERSSQQIRRKVWATPGVSENIRREAAARRGSRSNPGVDYISRDSTRIKLSKGCRWNVIDLIELNFKGGEKQKKTKDRDAKWPGD